MRVARWLQLLIKKLRSADHRPTIASLFLSSF